MATTAERKDVPTAIVFGRSGMGKSYLCNCLLYGSPYAEEGFRSEPGGDPITSECQAKTVDGVEPSDFALQTSIDILKPGGPLTMIDTPGIPDPAKRTLKFYDEIVRTVRDAGRLNAFIMMVKDGGDRKHIQDDLETYRILLKQFADLPVAKFVVCRMETDPFAPDRIKILRTEKARQWVTGILRNGGMESATQVYIHQDAKMMSEIFVLRSLVTSMPPTPIGNWNVKTYAELKASAMELSKGTTRIAGARKLKEKLIAEKKGLKESIAALEEKVEEANNASFLTVPITAGLALTGVGLIIAGIGGLVYHGVHASNEETYRSQIAENEKKIQNIEEKLVEVNQELETGVPNRKALEADKKTLQDLESLQDS